MATLVLQAVGATLGSVFGPIGSALGASIGAAAGYRIDQSLINSTRTIEGSRLSGARTVSAEDGAPIPRVYGYARITGTIIWATQLEEQKFTRRQGAKGGPKVTSYSYFGNVAFGLCEGEIAHVKRIWADGKELDLRDIECRIYRGSQLQQPDPLIQAKQGSDNAPAYKGLAYVVFEQLALERFGNRIPQMQFEVIRTIGALEPQIRAISIIPGATEHGLDPSPVTIKPSSGATIEVNRHQLYADSDWQASIDEL